MATRIKARARKTAALVVTILLMLTIVPGLAFADNSAEGGGHLVVLDTAMVDELSPFGATDREPTYGISPLATTVTDDATLRAAVVAAPTDGTLCTIVFGSDIVLVSSDLQIPTDTNIAIDGAGYTLTAAPDNRVISLTGATLTLAGITVTGGNAVYDAYSSTLKGLGGGIYAENSTIILDGNATVSDNVAGKIGGGIYARASTVTLADSAMVSGNTAADSGGGIAALGLSPDLSAVTLNDSATVSGNSATGPASVGGGIFVALVTLTLNGSATVSGNSSITDKNSGGAGIFAGSSIVEMNESATVSNNTATNAAGIFTMESTVTLNDSATVSSNTATGDAGTGGGIGTMFYEDSTITLNGSATVSGNTAVDGGGIFVGESNSLALNDSATVSNNTATDNGGGIYAEDASLIILDDSAALLGNVAGADGGGIYTDDYVTLSIPTGATVTFSQNRSALRYYPDTRPPVYDGAEFTGTVVSITPLWQEEPGWAFKNLVFNNNDINYTTNDPLLVVTFDANGGTEPDPREKAVVAGSPYGDLAAVARAGYTFIGWFTAPDDTGTEITADTVVAITAAQVLYAHWSPRSYTVRFLDYDGTTVLRSEQVAYGAAATPPADPQRAGYSFTGWDKSFTNITADIDIIALYQADSVPSEPDTEMPATGDASVLFLTLAAAAFVVGASLLVVRFRHRSAATV